MRILLLLPIITLFVVGCATKPKPVIVDVTHGIQIEQLEREPKPEPEPEPEPMTVLDWLKKRNYDIQKSGDGYTIKYDYVDRGSHYKGDYSLQQHSKIAVGDTTLEVEEDGVLKITSAGVGTERFP